MMYNFTTNKHYKIWFSKNPDLFLNIENQLRLIHMRQKNKSAEISLVYSSKALNPQALEALNKFCQKHNIRSVDFDHDIPSMLSHEQDIKIYAIAKEELEKALSHQGGNLAAASDCVRLVLPVIEQCGMYSDFDVGIQFNDLPKTITAEGPCLFPIPIKTEKAYQPLVLNNETMTFATDDTNPNKIHNVAINIVRSLQRQVIYNYQNLANAIYDQQKVHPDTSSNPLLKMFFEQQKNIAKTFIDKCCDYFNRNELDIFKLRGLLQGNITFKELMTIQYPKEMLTEMFGTDDYAQLSNEDLIEKYKTMLKNKHGFNDANVGNKFEEIFEISKHELLTLTVVRLSGPQSIINGLLYHYANLTPEEKLSLTLHKLENASSTSESSFSIPLSGGRNMVSLFEKCSLNGTPMLTGYKSANTLASIINSNHNCSDDLASNFSNAIGNHGDQSWTTLGQAKQSAREDVLNTSAKKIQKAYKQFCQHKQETTKKRPLDRSDLQAGQVVKKFKAQ